MRLLANGITLNYEVFGDSGPWVVLSHSLMCDLTMWGAQIDALKNHFRVLAFDTRGHGASEAPDAPYTLDQLAVDVKELLDSLEINSPHWVGLSMGGMIGMVYAIQFPNSFASLTLCDTTSRMPLEVQPAWRERIDIANAEGMKALVPGTMERWFTGSFLSEPRPELKFISTLIEKTPVNGYVGCCHAISQINCTDRLGEIQVPIKIMVGDSDVGTPVSMSKEIQAATHGSSLTIIEGASHLSNVEQPQQFNKALLDFLKEQSVR